MSVYIRKTLCCLVVKLGSKHIKWVYEKKSEKKTVDVNALLSDGEFIEGVGWEVNGNYVLN